MTRGIFGSLSIAFYVLALQPSPACAEHFDIQLSATASSGAAQQASADQSPPWAGLRPRPVLRARAGTTINFQFVMTNVYAHSSAPDAGVRYYVVREKAIGQRTTPPLQNLLTDGTFTFELKPKARIGVRQRVVIPEPGIYLLRVESARTQREHEHFAAIDLQIE